MHRLAPRARAGDRRRRGADGAALAVRLRAQLNRAVAIPLLVVVLPSVAIAERVREGAGRRVAIAAADRVTWLCGVTVTVRGRERLETTTPYVLVPNHSSFLDIPAMLLADGDVVFLAAAGLFRIPLVAGAMRAIGTEPIDRHNRSAAYAELRDLARRGPGRRLVVFAEGRIPPPGERLPFKPGAFVLAVATGAAVVPVAIEGTSALLPPGGRLAVRPGQVTVTFLEPLPADGTAASDANALRARTESAVYAALGVKPAR